MVFLNTIFLTALLFDTFTKNHFSLLHHLTAMPKKAEIIIEASLLIIIWFSLLVLWKERDKSMSIHLMTIMAVPSARTPAKRFMKFTILVDSSFLIIIVN